ncbi:hypothetical protein Bbelb_215870 [Branchiostoma belcheri]|nr:hypothetical protein Bbelb_215870 [Branchiostoma belcheri]
MTSRVRSPSVFPYRSRYTGFSQSRPSFHTASVGRTNHSRRSVPYHLLDYIGGTSKFWPVYGRHVILGKCDQSYIPELREVTNVNMSRIFGSEVRSLGNGDDRDDRSEKRRRPFIKATTALRKGDDRSERRRPFTRRKSAWRNVRTKLADGPCSSGLWRFVPKLQGGTYACADNTSFQDGECPCMDGKNERVKFPPKKTRHVRFSAESPSPPCLNYRYGGVEPEGSWLALYSFVRPAKLPPGLDSPVAVICTSGRRALPGQRVWIPGVVVSIGDRQVDNSGSIPGCDLLAPFGFYSGARCGPSYGKLRLYLTMFLCVLWDLSVFLSKFLEDLSGILCACPVFQEGFPVCVPEGPVTYLRDKRTSDLDLFRETGLRSCHLIWSGQKSPVITGFSQSGQLTLKTHLPI